MLVFPPSSWHIWMMCVMVQNLISWLKHARVWDLSDFPLRNILKHQIWRDSIHDYIGTYKANRCPPPTITLFPRSRLLFSLRVGRAPERQILIVSDWTYWGIPPPHPAISQNMNHPCLLLFSHMIVCPEHTRPTSYALISREVPP